MATPLEVFCCYAREDQALLLRLKKTLMLLQRQGLITIWSDIDIDAGTVWEQEIKKHLDSAHIILLLISPDFIASDYCYSIEMKRALDRHNQGSAQVIPILLRPTFCRNAPFAMLQMLPQNARPVTSRSDVDEAFNDIVEFIHQIVSEFQLIGTNTFVHRAPSKPTSSTSAKEQWLVVGKEHHDKGRYTEALAAYEQAIRLDPNNASAYNGKGDVLYELQIYQEALNAFEQAIRLNLTYAEAHRNRGHTLSVLGHYQEALAAFEPAIRLNPSDASAYHGKGNALSTLKRYQEALVAYEQAIRLNPSDANMYLGKSTTLFSLSRYNEALAACSQAIRLDPNNANVYTNKGTTLFSLSRYNEALAAYEQAIRLNPNNINAYSNKSAALCALHRYKEGLAACEQALRLDPTDTVLRKNCDFIRQILAGQLEGLNFFYNP